MRISDWSSDVCSSDLLLPSVGVSAGYSREAISEHGKFAALGAPTSASDFWQLGFEASWELDLWGRARRSREGAAAAFEATVYEREEADRKSVVSGKTVSVSGDLGGGRRIKKKKRI